MQRRRHQSRKYKRRPQKGVTITQELRPRERGRCRRIDRKARKRRLPNHQGWWRGRMAVKNSLEGHYRRLISMMKTGTGIIILFPRCWIGKRWEFDLP